MLIRTISVTTFLALAVWAGEEGDKLDTKFEVFHDRNDVTAVSPIFLLSKGIGGHTSVDWEGQLDVVTGASRHMGTSGSAGTSSLDGVSGASQQGEWEPRVGSRVGLAWSDKGRVFSGSLYASRERDYQSFSPAVGGSWDFGERNTTVSWGGSWFFDKEFPYGAWGLLGGGSKHVQSYNLGLSQILTPLSLIGGNVTFTRTTGYIGHPYNPVATLDSGLVAENLPTKKDAVAVAGQFLQGFHIGPNMGSFSTEYRAYEDSWMLKSHTVTLKWTQHLSDATIFRLQARWYKQWGAAFIQDQYVGDETYRTADIRYFPFTSYLLGAKAMSEFPDEWPGWAPRRWDLSYDHLWRDTPGNIQLYQLYAKSSWYMQGTARVGLSWDI
jgi:hypothetical protein